MRRLREAALASTELCQLYLRSTEDRESMARRAVADEEIASRVPLEQRVGDMKERVLSSLGEAEAIVEGLVASLLRDDGGVLAAIDLRRAREGLAAKFVKELLASRERNFRMKERTAEHQASKAAQLDAEARDYQQALDGERQGCAKLMIQAVIEAALHARADGTGH